MLHALLMGYPPPWHMTHAPPTSLWTRMTHAACLGHGLPITLAHDACPPPLLMMTRMTHAACLGHGLPTTLAHDVCPPLPPYND